MKKLLMMGIMACMTVCMAACGAGAKMPDLTEEEMQAVSEYAAVTLLKYDANSRSRLVDDEIIEEHDRKQELLASLKKPTLPEEEQGAQGETGQTQTPAQTVQAADKLEDFYTLPDGVRLVYAGYEVKDSYPDDGDTDEIFSIDATDGRKLLVLKFMLSNETAENQKIDFFHYNASYRITVNGQATRNALTTMLVNDLAAHIGEIGAGSNRELVLLMELDEEMLRSVDSVLLQLKNEEKSCRIQLQ